MQVVSIHASPLCRGTKASPHPRPGLSTVWEGGEGGSGGGLWWKVGGLHCQRPRLQAASLCAGPLAFRQSLPIVAVVGGGWTAW